MTPNEKAEGLINKFKPRVNRYFGRGMLSNAHDEDIATKNAIYQAIICVDEIIKVLDDTLLTDNVKVKFQIMWYKEVKQILQSKL